MPDSSWIFAKRSIGLSKIYLITGIFLSGFGVFAAVAIMLLGNGAPDEVFLFPVPFMAFGILMVSTSVVLLYVYDKNNGVLEYLLSIGWSQGDIFKRYLKAALYLGLALFVAELAAIVVAVVISGSLLGLMTIAFTAALGFSAMSLVTVAMMAFSSLQKQRVGANAPLGMILGVAVIIPTFYTPLLSFPLAFLADLSIAAIAGGLSLLLLILSGRLIRREKMLP